MGAFYSALLCLLIVGISRLLAFTNQGADRGTLLHVPLPEHTVMPDIELVKDGNEGSVVTSYVMDQVIICLLYTSPSPRDKRQSRMPSSA